MNTYKEGLLSLKEEIKRISAESRGFNKQIQSASGRERHAARQDKKAFGSDTRYLLLAYAFLRGKPYRAQERICAEDNQASANRILQIARQYSGDQGITLERVKGWLTVDLLDVLLEPAAEKAAE